MGIPKVDGDGFTKEVVSIEYEWKPPHCEHCKVFGHTDSFCPAKVEGVKQTSMAVIDDGFTKVARKKGKGTQNMDRQFEGISLTKPKPQFVYRQKLSSGASKVMDQPTSVPMSSGAAKGPVVRSNVASTPIVMNETPLSKLLNKVEINHAIDTRNLFSVLGDGVDEHGFDVGVHNQGIQGDHNAQSSTFTAALSEDVPDSDEDEVEEVYNECNT